MQLRQGSQARSHGTGKAGVKACPRGSCRRSLGAVVVVRGRTPARGNCPVPGGLEGHRGDGGGEKSRWRGQRDGWLSDHAGSGGHSKVTGCHSE